LVSDLYQASGAPVSFLINGQGRKDWVGEPAFQQAEPALHLIHEHS